MNRFVQVMAVVALAAFTAGMVMFCYRGCEIVIVHVYTGLERDRPPTEEQTFSHECDLADGFDFSDEDDKFNYIEADKTHSVYDEYPGLARSLCNYCDERHLCLRLLKSMEYEEYCKSWYIEVIPWDEVPN